MHIRSNQAVVASLFVFFGLPVLFCSAAATVTFSGGTSAGWDFHELDADIARNNTVDWSDLSILAQHWLTGGCGDADQWCGKADIDSSTRVDFIDYALLAEDWHKEAGQNVLLQTIYGTAQDSNGTITANTYKALQNYKGLAMAFNVSTDTVLDKAIFKVRGLSAGRNIQVRFYDIKNKGYLLVPGHPTPTRTDPSLGGQLLFDTGLVTIPTPAPSHPEGGVNYSDIIINFGPMEVESGDYLLVFDYIKEGSLSTACSFIQGTGTTSPPAMGTYPDGIPLPKRATVSSSGFLGNTYYYYLNSTGDASYSYGSNLFACQITTTIVNHTPTVDAGSNQTIINPVNSVNLDGTITDDGKPNPPGTVTAAWTKQSGPGTVTFADADAVDTTATFSGYGTYVLRLTANDGELSAYDEVTITYLESSPSNQPPTVNAGPDQNITLPAAAILDGTVTDDGLPNPPGIVTTAWSKISGPGTVTLANPSAVDTTASFSIEGTYVLRLTASDSQLSNYDELTITVNPVPAQAATLHWDGEAGDDRWETPSNWYCDVPARNNTLPTLNDTARGYYISGNGTYNITIDTVGVAKVQKWQQKAQVTNLIIQSGATLEVSGSVEIYQDDAWHNHQFTVYGTVNACTKSNLSSAIITAFKIGGHQSYSKNFVTVYGTLNILSSDPVGKGESSLWLGYASADDNASFDHNRLYIKPAGVVTTDNIFAKTTNAFVVDISTGGKLVEKGNKKVKLDGYIADSNPSNFSGDGIAGNVTVTYNAAANETVIEAGTLPRGVLFLAESPQDWPLTEADNVLLQTIYGTAQDINGNITANSTYTLIKDKNSDATAGVAMAFSVPAGKVVDKAFFKCVDIGRLLRMRMRLYNVTGQGYLQYGNTIGRAFPGGSGNSPVFDMTITSQHPMPYHLEPSDGRKYTDLMIDFGPDDVTGPGEYLITFDPIGKLYNYDDPQTPWGGMVRGLSADVEAMGRYPDGADLPKKATVTTSNATGNTYYYQLDSTSAANYTPYSNLFSCLFLTE